MKKILIANRGEIALRIMRTCKEMGIETVAVYSDADRNAPFVRYADEAVRIGPPPSNESYLRADAIIEVAKERGAEGIHPGYGFLSESAEFSRKVEEAGLRFIGPKAESIEVMGSKLASKAAVKEYDTPLVPGTDEAVEDPEEAMRIAKEIGFPVLIKASAGGGGKGMRIVEAEKDLEDQMERAISEAKNAFGDGSVFIERYVGSPKHIEVQVLADTHGNYVHLFERECSVQRRHQKVIEEAPSGVLTPELREQIGQTAIGVAKSCDYIGAGTVEFLLDEKKNFYFLEMNTRLQVEHPVTEMITGVDLVREQIRIARGEELPFAQEDLSITGHAIESRVYAEDPSTGFLPDIGTLMTYRLPQGPGIRVDDGFEEGMEIPIHYDPMIAKLVVHSKDRDQAIERMVRACKDFRIAGIRTTLPFCAYTVQHPSFRDASFDTHFVKEHFQDPSVLEEKSQENAELAGAVAAFLFEERKKKGKVQGDGANTAASEWKRRRARWLQRD